VHKQFGKCQTIVYQRKKGEDIMTKKINKGSKNQNSPRAGHAEAEFASEFVSGDNSKGNKRNKSQQSKTNPHE
jgi:hypothetical protein